MQEIAALFDLDPRTLASSIKQEGIELPIGHLLTPKVQKAIFEVIGYPNEHIKEELRHI